MNSQVWTHKTCLISPLFIEVTVPSQESEWSCICVLVVSILPLSTILILHFGTVPIVWYFFCFSFYFYRLTMSILDDLIFLIFKFLLYYINMCVRIPLRRDVLDTTLCDKVCQRLAAGLWFSPGTSVSSTNKTNCHNITEILLKVTLNTI